MPEFDVAIIGGGAAGLTAATTLHRQGLKVALIEKEKAGGQCTHSGCVPTKTLIHSAKVWRLLGRSQEFGLEPTQRAFSFAKVMAHKDAVVQEIGGDGSLEPFRQMGIATYHAQASFISPHELQVGQEGLRAQKFVIATGSVPAIPPIPGLAQTLYLSNETALRLKELPKSIIVLGGGPIGLEFAQVWARFGSQVTVLEMLEHLLPREDPEIALALEELLREEGLRIHTGTRVEEVAAEGTLKRVRATRNGKEETFRAEAILVATGRRAGIEGLNLAVAGVQADPRGVVVDDELRTAASHIWASGDVTGKYLFTHAAYLQSWIVAHNVALKRGRPRKADYRVVPWATFTDPEVARVGLTEPEAKALGHNVKVTTFSFRDVERSRMVGEAKGMFKLVHQARTGQIVGAHIVGPHADELIHEFVLAMAARIPVRRLSEATHIYPTLSEGVRWTAQAALG